MSIVVLWTAYERWHAWVMLSGGVAHDYRNYRNHTALFERRGCGTQQLLGMITHGAAQTDRVAGFEPCSRITERMQKRTRRTDCATANSIHRGATCPPELCKPQYHVLTARCWAGNRIQFIAWRAHKRSPLRFIT